jgi:hypothetical protein
MLVARPASGFCRYYGTEFTSKVLDHWAYFNGVELDFSRPAEARRQHVHRSVQRHASARVLIVTLVSRPRRPPPNARGVARRLQQPTSAQQLGGHPAGRVWGRRKLCIGPQPAGFFTGLVDSSRGGAPNDKFREGEPVKNWGVCVLPHLSPITLAKHQKEREGEIEVLHTPPEK